MWHDREGLLLHGLGWGKFRTKPRLESSTSKPKGLLGWIPLTQFAVMCIFNTIVPGKLVMCQTFLATCVMLVLVPFQCCLVSSLFSPALGGTPNLRGGVSWLMTVLNIMHSWRGTTCNPFAETICNARWGRIPVHLMNNGENKLSNFG